MSWTCDTPVSLFVYNRPEKTRKVVRQVATVEPPTLLVVADGPQESTTDDAEKVSRTRAVIEDAVDWDCDLRREYAVENLGIYERFVTGLKWVFSQVSESIILEDDCVPAESFFRFCEKMLETYRDDERIMEITGYNVVGEWKSDIQDYHFSHYGSHWGWATWRRAWEWYDPEMTGWECPEIRARVRDTVGDESQADYLEYLYNRVYQGEIDTWDYQWRFSKQINSALSIVPSRNLITNIGFDAEATHTDSIDSELGGTERYSLDFPIRENDFVAVDSGYDDEFYNSRPASLRYGPLRFAKQIYDRYDW